MEIATIFSGIALVFSGASLAIAYWNRQTILTNQTIAGPRVEQWTQTRGLHDAPYRIVRLNIHNDPSGLWKIGSLQLKSPGNALFSRCGESVSDALGSAVDYAPIEWLQNIQLDGNQTFLAKPYDREISVLVTLCAKSDASIQTKRAIKLPV